MGVFNLLAQTQDITPVTTSYDVTTTTVQTSGGFWAALGAMWLVWLIIFVLAVVAYWKIFSKAGEAGWQSIIPIWSTIVLLKIVGRPWWWLLLMLIPVVQIVIFIIVMLDLGKSFGKSSVFSIFGLIIFSLVGYFILGFGDAKYVGPAGSSTSASPTPVAN